jgi:hypothetical protein
MGAEFLGFKVLKNVVGSASYFVLQDKGWRFYRNVDKCMPAYMESLARMWCSLRGRLVGIGHFKNHEGNRLQDFKMAEGPQNTLLWRTFEFSTVCRHRYYIAGNDMMIDDPEELGQHSDEVLTRNLSGIPNDCDKFQCWRPVSHLGVYIVTDTRTWALSFVLATLDLLRITLAECKSVATTDVLLYLTCLGVPQLRSLVVGFPPWWPGFKPVQVMSDL